MAPSLLPVLATVWQIVPSPSASPWWQPESLGATVIGIAITAAVGYAAKATWERFVSDIWLKLTAKEVPRIGRRWHTTFRHSEEEFAYDESIDFKQFGWKVTGTLHYAEIEAEAGKETRGETKDFALKGVIKGNTLVGHYSGNFGSGCVVLYFRDDDVADGACIWVDADGGINCDRSQWLPG